MSELGLAQCFHAKTKIDIQLAYENMSKMEEIKWNNSRFNMPKLRYYNLYKAYFETEDYVQENISKRLRSVMAQFRAGILPLEIETGRYTGKPLDERLCKFCDQSVVEDEYHFLCCCELYKDERNILYRDVSQIYEDFNDMDIFDKFIFLSSNVQKQVAAFINIALQKRSKCKYIDS